MLLNKGLVKAGGPVSWNASRTNSCGSKPEWQKTLTVWLQDGVDIWLSDWWNRNRLNANANFAHDLGYQFGSHQADFTCGIGEISRCSSPGCTGEYFGTHRTFMCLPSFLTILVQCDRV